MCRAIGLILILLLVFPLRISAFFEPCKCHFDTSEYDAEATGEGYCSSTTLRGKRCKINYGANISKPKNAEVSTYYGSFEYYQNNVRIVSQQLGSKGASLLWQKDFIIKDLPLLIRTSYASADFVKPDQRSEMDKIIISIFDKHSTEIMESLLGRAKQFQLKGVTSTKGKVVLKYDDLIVDFHIQIP